MRDTLKAIRREDKTAPAYAWPGGYPIVYVCEDGAILCAECVNRKNGAVPRFYDDGSQDGWFVVGHQIHWEGAPEVCAHCNAEIASAYGEAPDESEA